MLGQISLFTILLLGVSTVRSQVELPNPCPKVKVVEHFDVNRFMGKWIQQSEYYSAFGATLTCPNSVYSLNADGTIAVTLNGLAIRNGQPTSVSGTAKIIGPGVFSVTFGYLELETHERLLLATDYEKLNVLYSCANTKSGHIEHVWILTRERQPTHEVIQAAEQVLKDNNLSTSYLNYFDQSGCTN